MKVLKIKNYLLVVLSLIVLISICDLVIPEDDPNRFIAVFLQGLLLSVLLFFFIKTFLLRKAMITYFHCFLAIFVLMLISYGIFSNRIDRLPIVIYSVISFYLFFHAAYKRHLTEHHVQILSVILLIIISIETYIGIIERSIILDQFYTKADNTGYNALYLMLLLSINIKNRINIYLFSLAYILVLLSFKRGALLIGTLSYLIVILSLFRINIKGFIDRKKILFSGILAASLILYILFNYFHIIAYRFLVDSTGSGRAEFYSIIYKGWEGGGVINKLFGFGFYKVPEFLYFQRGTEIYAHSDWLELLYDHGIFGVIIYLILIISLCSYTNTIKRINPDLYPAFLMVMCVWLLKAIFSGVYINRGSVFLFMVIGTILGLTFIRKHDYLDGYYQYSYSKRLLK